MNYRDRGAFVISIIYSSRAHVSRMTIIIRVYPYQHTNPGLMPVEQVWKDALSTKAKSPYLVQQYPGLAVRDVQYCPFEDILGVSHSKGFTSMVMYSDCVCAHTRIRGKQSACC